MDVSPGTKGNRGQPALSLPLLVCQELTGCLAHANSFNLLGGRACFGSTYINLLGGL